MPRSTRTQEVVAVLGVASFLGALGYYTYRRRLKPALRNSTACGGPLVPNTKVPTLDSVAFERAGIALHASRRNLLLYFRGAW